MCERCFAVTKNVIGYGSVPGSGGVAGCGGRSVCVWVFFLVVDMRGSGLSSRAL